MITILISVLLFLFPFFFLPITPDFFEPAKIMLLSVFNLVLLAVWLFKIFKSKNLVLKSSPLDFFVILFSSTSVLSLIFRWSTINHYQAIYQVYYLLNLLLLYFLILNNSEKKHKVLYSRAMVLSGIILTIYSFVMFILPKTVFPKIITLPFGFQFSINDYFFTPTGNHLISFSYLLVLASLLLPDFLRNLKSRFSLSFLFTFAASFIIMAGLSLEGYKLLWQRPPVMLPLAVGWTVAVEGFKPLVNFLFGIGPGNFLQAFNQFKPAFFNQDKNWSVRFGNSSNEYFQILTTIGLFGLIAYLILALKSISLSLKNKSYVLPIIFILGLFISGHYLIYFALFVFLALLAIENSEVKVNFSVINNLFYFIPAGLFLILSLSVYFAGRAYMADVYFQKAQIAMLKNQGQDAYNFQGRAISTNPYKDTYHANQSILSLVFATNLSTKKDLTDQDKQLISALVQQATTEARNAVFLSPNNSANLANLGFIYKNLINTAQGADQWAIVSYQQAIAKEPNNPQLRFDLASLYHSLKAYDPAIDVFKTVISLKPDLANAYYNLAYVYKDKQDYFNAVAAMEAVLTLVDKNSNDFKTAQADLEELKKLLPVPSVTPVPVKPETLSVPSPVPTKSPAITPIVLPEPTKEATKEVTKEPTKEPTQEVSPSPNP